jgi:hypothetical protein
MMLADISRTKKAKIVEIENNSKIKNIRELYRDINDFKMG